MHTRRKYAETLADGYEMFGILVGHPCSASSQRLSRLLTFSPDGFIYLTTGDSLRRVEVRDTCRLDTKPSSRVKTLHAMNAALFASVAFACRSVTRRRKTLSKRHPLTPLDFDLGELLGAVGIDYHSWEVIPGHRGSGHGGEILSRRKSEVSTRGHDLTSLDDLRGSTRRFGGHEAQSNRKIVSVCRNLDGLEA